MALPGELFPHPNAEQESVIGSLYTSYGGLHLGVLAALGE
jgi:hypothetical protein